MAIFATGAQRIVETLMEDAFQGRLYKPDLLNGESASSDGNQHLERIIDSLIKMCALVLKQRDCCGAYLGVSGPQYVMIKEIGRSTSVTATELARKLDVSGSFVAVEVNKLVDLAFVEKRPNPHDARSVVLELSGKGRNALAELEPIREEMERLMCRSLKRDDTAAGKTY